MSEDHEMARRTPNAMVVTFADRSPARCDYLLTSLEEADFPAQRSIERLHQLSRGAT